MNIEKVINEIQFGKLREDDLSKIIAAVRFRREILIKDIKKEIHVGDKVWFAHNGGRFSGRIKEIRMKNVVIQIGGYHYTMPINMIERDEDFIEAQLV